jgi:hypothetical protein
VTTAARRPPAGPVGSRAPRLRIGATVADASRVYRSQAPLLLATAAIVFVPLALLEAVLERFGHLEVDRADVLTGAIVAATFAEFGVAALGDEFYAGIVAAAVGETRSGRRRPRLRRLARELPYLRLIAADLIITTGTSIGLDLLLVPGLVFYTWFGLAGPLIKIEGLDVRAGLARSHELVRGSFAPVFVLLGLLYVGGNVFTVVVQQASVWSVGDSFLGDWAGASVVALLVTPIEAVVAVVIAYRLIELKGGRKPLNLPGT